ESFEAICKRMGISPEEDCTILSIYLTIDGTIHPFDRAFQAADQSASGSLIVATGKNVAFFFGELPNERCIVRGRHHMPR
ncbi:MAG: hypothetical protein ACTHK7_14340, partial [Aureliella sp.]